MIEFFLVMFFAFFIFKFIFFSADGPLSTCTGLVNCLNAYETECAALHSKWTD